MSIGATASSAASPPSGRQAEYVVVARRYRPQTFEELLGQEHVARALSGAITSNRVGHAYLFTGARGVGKTSAARILAKALNCVEGPTPTPCNRCDVGLCVNAGEDVDVLEIDGASNRGIDEIRELRQNVRVRPSRVRFKIYIIDEVHMLTKEAFNALLKTLEEPPEHVKFIFCTTEPEKIPITILSRCQRFDFAGIQTSAIAGRLRQIVEAEGVQADQDALEILARRAAGSMRDSQSLLEQLLSFGGPKITVAEVNSMLGTAGSERLGALVAHLLERRSAEALHALDAAIGEGVDVGQLLEQLMGYFRDCMAASAGCTAEHLLYTWGEEQQRVLQAGKQLGLETVLAMLQILDQTAARLRYSTHRRTLVELALVRICKLEDLDGLAALIGQLRDGAPIGQPALSGKSLTTGASPDSGDAAKKKPDEPLASADLNGTTTESGFAAREEAVSPAAERLDGPAETPPGTPLTSENAAAVWRQVLARFNDLLAEHAGFSHRVAALGPDRLVVSFAKSYNVSKSICERPDQAARLESALAEVTGRTVRLQFELSDDAAVTTEEPAARRPASGRERLMEKSQHPLVRRACEVFNAQPVRVEEN